MFNDLDAIYYRVTWLKLLLRVKVVFYCTFTNIGLLLLIHSQS
jgi:hypothetical protein